MIPFNMHDSYESLFGRNIMSMYEWMTILTIGTFVYSLPFDELVKMTLRDALDYSRLIPNVRSE